jgi:sigma-B regulation protein RsbU (phosphoserine phosphatase)
MPDKILIVDDHAVNRDLLVHILKKEGYDLIEAADGEEAVDRALREMPDLILLDIMMPKKDGYEVCSELKHDEQAANIPIIFLSAKTATEDKIRGLDVGGSDYMTKPFEKREVVARVRAQLKIQHLTKALLKANEGLLEKQQSLDDDLKAASEIQKSLLPKGELDIHGVDVAWRFMPCQRIGGDLLNIFRLDEDHWAIYMLDVSGHGVPSAMVAVSVSQMLRPQTGYLSKRPKGPSPFYSIVSPADVLNALDREYPIERFDKFFTISYLVLNARTGLLRYSNGAHPPPVLLHKDGPLELLDEGGTIIGMGGVLPFEEGSQRLRFGDRLFLYTDGIVEYRNRDGASYGEDRLYGEIKRSRKARISRSIDGIIYSMRDFGKGAEPQDDISLFGLEFRGGEEDQRDES